MSVTHPRKTQVRLGTRPTLFSREVVSARQAMNQTYERLVNAAVKISG